MELHSQASDDYCHDTSSIHLINLHPAPSKLSLALNETRLDKFPYFVVPDDVLQLAVKVSGPKPLTWSFTASGDGVSCDVLAISLINAFHNFLPDSPTIIAIKNSTHPIRQKSTRFLRQLNILLL